MDPSFSKPVTEDGGGRERSTLAGRASQRASRIWFGYSGEEDCEFLEHLIDCEMNPLILGPKSLPAFTRIVGGEDHGSRGNVLEE